MNLGGIDAHWWWLLAAALLGILELAVSGVFLIWVAVAALITGLVVMGIALPLPFQLALFALLAIASVYSGRRLYDRNPVASADPLLNDRIARLIGQNVVVVAAIQGGEGRVKVGDGVWAASGPDAPAGARVRVIGADGACLRVEPVAGALDPPA